jgi:hypothetical protein
MSRAETEICDARLFLNTDGNIIFELGEYPPAHLAAILDSSEAMGPQENLYSFLTAQRRFKEVFWALHEEMEMHNGKEATITYDDGEQLEIETVLEEMYGAQDKQSAATGGNK